MATRNQRALAQKYIWLLGLKSVVVTFEPDGIGDGIMFYSGGKYHDPSMAAMFPDIERLTFDELSARVDTLLKDAYSE